MKQILLFVLTSWVFTLSCLGQGTIWFVNTASTLVITDIGPYPIPAHPATSSEDVWVEILWAPLGTTDLNLFQVVGPAARVGGVFAGRFSGGTRTIPAGMNFDGIGPGFPVSAVVRGWIGSGFSSALFRSVSPIFTVDTGDPTLTLAETPASITRATQFTGLIISIPEPASAALLLLGAGLAMPFRRRPINSAKSC